MSRLKEKYLKEILPNLQKELGLTNSMQVPRIKKITLNMGVGEVLQDKKAIEIGKNNGIMNYALSFASSAEDVKIMRQLVGNDANIISIPARFMSLETSTQIIKTFLTEPFEGGRHQRRVEKI